MSSPRGEQNRGLPSRHGRPVALSRLAAALAAALAGCAASTPLRLDLAADVVRPARSVVILWADGLDHRRLDELNAAGRLPHIRRLFFENGVVVEKAFDCFPSATYPNGASLITGRFSSRHGITSNLWLDRRTLQSTDYLTLATWLDANRHLAGPTLYEILSDHFTLNIHCHSRRGASRSIDPDAVFGFYFAFGGLITADRLTSDRFGQAAAVANEAGRWPSVVTVYCCGIDEIGHRFGPDSPQYQEAIENMDTIVGRLADALAEAGLSDRTYLLLVSDHGMSPVRLDRTVHLQQWLREQRGLAVRCAPLTAAGYEGRLREIGRYDAFVSVGSDRAAAIHLRGRRGWTHPPEPSEAEAFVLASPSLLDLSAVDCAVVRRGPDCVKVLSARGSAAIERRTAGGRKEYRLVELRGDPLGYESDAVLAAFVAQGWHGSREWLGATAQSSHPDFVPQAAEMFDSPRTGDVVLFAADEAALSRDFVGGHGSCLLRDVHVVQMYAGPGLPAGGSVAFSRFVDVAPTVIGLLGESKRLERFPPMDGIDLTAQLKSAEGPRRNHPQPVRGAGNAPVNRASLTRPAGAATVNAVHVERDRP